MSIRIHEIAKRIGTDSKTVIAELKKRSFDVTTASSSIDNISAEAFIEEFAKEAADATPDTEVPAPVRDIETEPQASPVTGTATATPTETFTTKQPVGIFVKTAEDVAAEKAAAAAEKAAARVAPVLPKKPDAVSAPPPPPPPPRAVSAPPPPPRLPVRTPTPPPAPVISHATQPAPAAEAPKPPAAPSAPADESIPASAEPSPHASAPATPPPLPPHRGAPKAPPPIVSAPSTPAMPATPPAQTATIVTQGDIKVVHLKPPVIVRDFATVLGIKPFKLISELMEMGVFASMNQSIEEPIAIQLAEKHGFLLEIKRRGEGAAPAAPEETEKQKRKRLEQEEAANLAPRAPIVCILGHVDHGKTSLLDAIRKAKVAAGEAGGITQHIGAYQVERDGRKITFLDTPGHAAFNKMRARGAQVTDIAILVVAADDGFKPQTDEALKYIKESGVALMVAINKMDVKGANPDRVKQMMQERGIPSEDWGGETITVPVSAIKGDGISDLLDMLVLQADVLELKANPKAAASGVIIESQVDVGRGPLATVIVQRGTLRTGDAIVCGTQWAKVRAMFDDQGKNVREAPPSTPVRVIGWSGAPDSGATFTSVKNARAAESLADEAADELKQQQARSAAEPKDVSIESLFANIAATQQKVLKIIVKADAFGSTEAVRSVLGNIQSTKVDLDIVSTDVGLITKNDILMATAAGGAVVIGFNTRLENGVTPLAKHQGIRIETFDIIYELADKVKEMMADLLEPDLKEVKLGAAEIRAVFSQGKGFVAGCMVTEGKVTRNALARVRRKKDTVHEGKIVTLKRFKDDANEVRAGLECGIKIDDFNGYEEGDLIEIYEIQKVRASL